MWKESFSITKAHLTNSCINRLQLCKHSTEHKNEIKESPILWIFVQEKYKEAVQLENFSTYHAKPYLILKPF